MIKQQSPNSSNKIILWVGVAPKTRAPTSKKTQDEDECKTKGKKKIHESTTVVY